MALGDDDNRPLRGVPIHRSLNRPSLFLGCDREMIMFAGLMAGVMIFLSMSLVTAVLGVLFWLFSMFVLRLMAKSDPKMRHVYLRHRSYKRYYAARPTPFKRDSEAKSRRMGDPWKR
jgi:type IV secretion system protein VirB3